MIKSNEWFPSLDSCISSGDIKSFPTKSAALSCAREFGWYQVVRVERRFEKVWIAGVVDFQTDIECGVEFEVVRVPLLRWEKDGFGISFCPIAKFRKPKKQ